MRHGVKISLSLLLILCIMALYCMPVYAAPVALSAAEELTALWAMYCEGVGFDTVYTTNGVKNGFSSPYSSTAAANNIANLYSQYCTFSGRVETMQQTVDWIKANTEIAISTQQTGAFQYAAGVTEFFDKFSTWVLEDVVGVVKNAAGEFESGTWFNNTLTQTQASNLYMPVFSGTPNKTQVINNGRYFRTLYNVSYYQIAPSGYNVLFCTVGNDYNGTYLCSSRITCWQVGSSSSTVTSVNLSSSSSGVYYGYSLSGSSGLASWVPHFSSISDAVTWYRGYTITEDSRIQLRPKDEYNEGVLGIPDVANPDYIATDTIGVTSVPWTDSLTLDDILSRVLSLELANENVLEGNEPLPEPVIAPLVPFELPSLEFSFSGIWHYVISWIGSIRSGFSFISSTWAALPYAMVIPIYASAVVVIVIGTFKRFFS